MEKLKMHSPNLTIANIEKIKALFPNCVTESTDESGSLKLAVDFDQLRQELSDSIVEGPQERYHLNWPGKREALLTANAPIAKTLRPAPGESVDFENTKNLFIEGDNLEALKLLQETYLGKVKMIYIDPPYNTGRDFLYEDDFAESTEEFLIKSNQKDEAGNRLVANTESNGRYHSDWLTMMMPRLKLARNLMSEDAVIFISIDDNEQHNIRKLCDEVFGEKNFIELLIWRKKSGGGQQDDFLVTEHDYILCYAKSKLAFKFIEKAVQSKTSGYNLFDEKKKLHYKKVKLAKWGSAALKEDRPTMYDYPELINPDGNQCLPVSPDGRPGRWRYGRQRVIDMIENDNIAWELVDGEWQAYEKDYEPSENDMSILKERSIFYDLVENGEGAKELTRLFGMKDVFQNPKPSDLVAHLSYLSLEKDKEQIALDFFAGSGTTGHSIIELNRLDGGKRKFILVQIPEDISPNKKEQNTAYQFCLSNNLKPTIAEISKERIRRAGKKILEGNCHENWNKDVGFRVLKVDSSNMKDVYYSPNAINQADLLGVVENIKPDRKPEDLLFQVLLDWGVDLSLSITKQNIQGKTVFFVNQNPCDLVACFDKGITEELVKEIAKTKPLRVVFTDIGFVSDSVKINAQQIFKQISPSTDIKAI